MPATPTPRRAYGVTAAEADRLLALARGQWQIENRIYYVNGCPLGGMTLGEDRSMIHKGNGPSVMAMLQDTVVSLLHQAGWRTITERLQYYSGNIAVALALLGIPLVENA